MGITVPDDIFSLGGIFNLVMQVLGLSWDFLRMKSVKMMGEPTVKALETGADEGFSMFTTFKTKGVDGIWEYLQDKFTDLQATVIDAIKDMLITQVIEAGIKWLLSLLIPALIEGIMALASGSVAGVAKAIEFGLAKLIPLVIGLFAKLIGLGGLSKRVMKIFKKIRKRIDKAVNKLLAKAKKAARKIMRKLGIGKKGDKKKTEEIKGKKTGDGEVGEVVPFGQGHKLFINATGGTISVISQSTRMPVVARIKQWTDDANALSDADKKTKLLSLLSQAKGKLSDTEKHALKAEQLKDAKTDSEKAFIKADNATEDSEKELAQILEEIYTLLDKQNKVQLDPIPVNFGPIPDKYDKGEYFSQLKGQEEGINALKVHDWLSNRANYSANGRAASGSVAQADYRAQVFKVLVKLRLDEQKDKGQKLMLLKQEHGPKVILIARPLFMILIRLQVEIL